MISLLIQGFLSVNARLLIAFGTAFYAIMLVDAELWIRGVFDDNCSLIFIRPFENGRIMLYPSASVRPSVRKLFRFRVTPPTVYVPLS